MTNLAGGAGRGYGLPLELFGEAIKRIRGFLLAKTAGFLHKKGKASMFISNFSESPTDFIIQDLNNAFELFFLKN